MNFLDTLLQNISDTDILQLIDELEHITHTYKKNFSTVPLQHYLQCCLYPSGASEKPYPIDRKDLDSHFFNSIILSEKIKNFKGNLYSLCLEIASRNHDSIENWDGRSLYVFLNRMLIIKKQRKKPKRLFY